LGKFRYLLIIVDLFAAPPKTRINRKKKRKRKEKKIPSGKKEKKVE